MTPISAPPALSPRGRLTARGFGLLLKLACISAYQDNLLGTAKGAAYSGLLSFFPVLTTVATILVTANAEAVSHVLLAMLTEAVPPGTESLVMNIFTTRGQRPGYLLILAGLLSLWGASGMMISLMQGFQIAYRVDNHRSFWRQRAVAVLLVIASALPVIAASTLLVFGSRTEAALISFVSLVTQDETLANAIGLATRVVQYIVSLSAIAVATSLLYHFGPDRPRRWRSVWPGAILTTVLWLFATLGFGWYVRNIANYNVLYGSIGAGIALLVWMYVLSVIALFGCEFNAQREKLRQLDAILPHDTA